MITIQKTLAVEAQAAEPKRTITSLRLPDDVKRAITALEVNEWFQYDTPAEVTHLTAQKRLLSYAYGLYRGARTFEVTRVSTGNMVFRVK